MGASVIAGATPTGMNCLILLLTLLVGQALSQGLEDNHQRQRTSPLEPFGSSPREPFGSSPLEALVRFLTSSQNLYHLILDLGVDWSTPGG